MILRIVAFLMITAALLVIGQITYVLVALGGCGMGPDAQQSCYDAQIPWLRATIAAFVAAEAAAAILIFRRRKGT